jgi:hypothetical protein
MPVMSSRSCLAFTCPGSISSGRPPAAAAAAALSANTIIRSWRRPAQSSELVTAEGRTRRVRQSHRPMLHRQRARAFAWQVQLSVCLCESSSYLPLSHIVAQLIVVHCLKALGVTHTSLPSRMRLSSTVSILRFLCLTAQYKKQQILTQIYCSTIQYMQTAFN